MVCKRLSLGVLLCALASSVFAATHATENIFLISVDGFRWQEVFGGAEPSLINKENGVDDTNRLNAAYLRPTPEERRRALLPFFWETIAKEGQLYGNANKGSVAKLTNGKKFTYPGFNEILPALQMLELTRMKSVIIPMYLSWNGCIKSLPSQTALLVSRIGTFIRTS